MNRNCRISSSLQPLQTLLKYNRIDLITNPVIIHLVWMKWNQFGKWIAVKRILLNVFYTLLWTAATVGLPKGENPSYYNPPSTFAWRIVLEIICVAVTIYFIVAQFIHAKGLNTKRGLQRRQAIVELQRELQFCHPRWPNEKSFIDKAIGNIRLTRVSIVNDAWDVIEWITYIGIIALIISRITFVASPKKNLNYVHTVLHVVVLIFLWLRLLKYFRPFHYIGPFIEMLGYVAIDTLKFLLLFVEVFIPYVCGFWILFGNLKEYTYFSDVVFEVFQMTIVGDYTFDPLVAADKYMAQLMVGSYITIAFVVCLNLYIAILSESFNRVFCNATARAYMRQVAEIVETEEFLPLEVKMKIDQQVLQNFAPEVVYDLDLEIENITSELKSRITDLDNTISCLRIKCQENLMHSEEIERRIGQLKALSKQHEYSQRENLLLTTGKINTMRKRSTGQAILRSLDLLSDDDDSSLDGRMP